MEESDSGQQQKRCPCGFFGSAQTSGLCSKCYKATVQPDKGQDPRDAKAEIMRNKEHSRVPQYSSHDPVSAASSSSFYHSNVTTSTATGTDSSNKPSADTLSVAKQTGDKHDKLSVGNVDKLTSGNIVNSDTVDSAVKPSTSNTSTNTENAASDSDKTAAEGISNSDINKANGDNTGTSSDINIANRGGNSSDINITSNEKYKLLETDGGQEKRGVKRDSSVLDEQPSTPEKGSGAKTKKRCGVCRCKLELAQRAIGRCKCDNVFCSLHRLPEQHDCQFDHKEDGRREAREKMVKPTRHLGTSFKRLDSDS